MGKGINKWMVLSVGALILVSLVWSFVALRLQPKDDVSVHVEDVIFVAYPYTFNSTMHDPLTPYELICKAKDCGGYVQIVDSKGESHQVHVDGMLGSQIDFSDNNKSLLITDAKHNHVFRDGVYQKEKLDEIVLFSQYASIENSGDYLTVGHLGSGDDGKGFGNNIVYHASNETIQNKSYNDGSVFECDGNVYLFTNKYDDSVDKDSTHEEFLFDNKSKSFHLIDRPYDKKIPLFVGRECMKDGSIRFIADERDGQNYLVSGRYTKEKGLEIDKEAISYEYYMNQGSHDPAIFESDKAWLLSNDGKMHVFDLNSREVSTVWDAGVYYPKDEFEQILALYIYHKDAVFYFGRPKGINHWVMIELDRITGKPQRSVRMPLLDEKFTNDDIQEIAIGDVDKFRAWADTQPKFDLSTIGE